MELREFVSRALRDILNGVKDAQKETDKGAIVPSIKNTFKSIEAGISEVTSVEFEVTVRADEQTGKEAKLNVVAAIVAGGVKGASGSTSGHAAKLSFRVPIRYPRGE